jgi:hypothetical protein
LALLSLADRLSTSDRRSPIIRFSSSERLSVPDRLSFVVRLSAPDRFLMSPIVCLRWLPRIVVPTRYREFQARESRPGGLGKKSPSFATGAKLLEEAVQGRHQKARPILALEMCQNSHDDGESGRCRALDLQADHPADGIDQQREQDQN